MNNLLIHNCKWIPLTNMYNLGLSEDKQLSNQNNYIRNHQKSTHLLIKLNLKMLKSNQFSVNVNSLIFNCSKKKQRIDLNKSIKKSKMQKSNQKYKKLKIEMKWKMKISQYKFKNYNNQRKICKSKIRNSNCNKLNITIYNKLKKIIQIMKRINKMN